MLLVITPFAFAQKESLLAQSYFHISAKYKVLLGEDVVVNACGQGLVTLDVYFFDLPFVNYSDDSEALVSLIKEKKPIKTITQQLGSNTDACKEINLNLDFPGFFVVRGRNDVTQVTRTIAFSIESLSLLVKSDNEKTIVWVASAIDGKPLENAEVKLFAFSFSENPLPLGLDDKVQGRQENALIKSLGFTNALGLLEFKNSEVSALNDDKDKIVVFVKKDKDFAYSNFSYFKYYESPTEDDLIVYAFTDRPIYRPNQTVFIKAIVWNNFEKKAVSGKTIKLKVIDPKNNTVLEKELQTNEFGSIATELLLSDEPALGTYSIIVDAGKNEVNVPSEMYAADFEVQEYLKPEFFVEVNPEKDVLISGEKALIEVKATYFFGAPVSNAKVLYKIYSQRYAPPCRGYWRCLYFDKIIPPWPPYYSAEVIMAGETLTDSEGKAFIEFNVKEEQPKKYYIEAKVIDKSNREVIGSGYIIVASAEFQLFVRASKAFFAESEKVKLIIEAKDFSLQPINTQAQLNVYKVVWNPNTKEYSQELVYSAKVLIENGQKEYFLEKLSAGEYSVEVIAKDSKERQVKGETSFSVVSDTTNTVAEFNASLDKDFYLVGENALLSIQFPTNDFYNVFISLEGRKLFNYTVVSFQENTTTFSIPITEDYQPNAFIHIAAIKNGKLFFKELLLSVPPREKKLDLEILTDKSVYLPREKVHLTIKATNLGKPVKTELAVGVVDEAIYSLKEDKRDIFKYFFAFEYNRVLSVWNYDFTIPYFGLPLVSKAESDMPAVSSAESKAFVVPMIRRLFADTAFWTAFIQTNDSGIAEIEFELPDNLTTWRATVVASNENKAGSNSFKFLESKNLIARLITPRFFTQGDTSKVIAIVNSNLNEMKDVKFELLAEGIEIVGSNTAELTVATSQSEKFEFNVKATECCTAKLTLKALTDIESDAIEVIVPVLPFGIKKTKAFAGEVDQQAIEEIVFPENIVENASKIKINITPSIAAGIIQGLEYLTGYPFGCVEQTMSRFLPDLIVWNALKELNLQNEKLEKDLPDMVNRGLQRLYNYQASDGGWGWWQDNESHPFMTAYVMYGLTLAKNLNFNVDMQVFEKGLNALKSHYSKTTDNEIRAFIAYVLKLNGYSEYVNRLEPDFDSLSSYGKALFILSKDDNIEPFLQKLLNEANCNEMFCSWKGKSWHYSWTENDVEPTAWALKALLKVRPSDEKVRKTVRWLMSKREDNYWLSTQGTAATLFALTDFLKYSNELNPNYTVKLYVNNQLLKELTVNKENFLSLDGTLVIESPAKNNEIRIEKKGEGRLYYSILQEYFEKKEQITAENNGISVERIYSKNELKVGEEAEVILKIKGNTSLDYVILEDYLPAGVTVIEEKQRGYPRPYGGPYFEVACFNCYYQRFERRDEKVVFFFTNLNAGEEQVVSYKIRGELPGNYKVLPARAELMYEPQIYGFSNQALFNVTAETSFSLPQIKVLPNEIIVKVYPVIENATMAVDLLDSTGKLITSASITGPELRIPLSTKLSDGPYSVRYSISFANTKFSGSKTIQQGFIEPKAFKVENISMENELLFTSTETSTAGKPLFGEPLTLPLDKEEQQFNFILVALVIILVITVVALVRLWIKKS